MNKNRYPPLQSGRCYHILNQGNDGVNLFYEDRNYHYFMAKYRKYIAPKAQTYAYCLMPNHFHLLIRIKDYDELHEASPKRFTVPPIGIISAQDIQSKEHQLFDESISSGISRQFADFFSGYAYAINNAGYHKGKLFSLPFDRILVDNDEYFNWLITYIHRNPIHHWFCKDYITWPYSSYNEIIQAFEPSNINTAICDIAFLKSWYQNKDQFLNEHEKGISHLLDKKYMLDE